MIFICPKYYCNNQTDNFYSPSKCKRNGAPIHPMYFECTGNEERLSQCESYAVTRQQLLFDEDLYCEPGMDAVNIYSTLHTQHNNIYTA